MTTERGSTTNAPPPSYGRTDKSTATGGPGLSVVSSSQLSPKSPAPRDRNEGSRTVLISEHNSWGEAGEERRDRRRRSTVTFGGATSVAPSSSISKRGPRTSADTQNRSGRRRSAPWQDVDYRSAKAGSSHGGTALTGSGAPLTERNMEVLNERQPPRSEASAERAVEREVAVTELELDPKVTKKSRRDSGVVTQAAQTEARSVGAETRRTSKRYSRVEYGTGQTSAERPSALKRSSSQSRARNLQPRFLDEPSYLSTHAPDLEAKNRRRHRKFRERRDGYESEEGEILRKSNSSRGLDYDVQNETVVSTRRKTEIGDDDDSNEEVETKTKARYESDRGPRDSSESRFSRRRQSRAADVYAKSAGRRQPDGSAGNWNSHSRSKSAFAYSRPPTMPPEETQNVTSSRSFAIVPVNTMSGARTGGRSRTATDTNGNDYEEYSGQTEVKSKRYSSQEEIETEQKSAVAGTNIPARSAGQLIAPSGPNPTAGASAASSPSEPSQSPQSANPPSVPGTTMDNLEAYWERRLHIVETRQPDGKLIQDREYSMRRIRPQMAAEVS